MVNYTEARVAPLERYVFVGALPAGLQAALRKVSYGKRDVRVIARDSVVPAGTSGTGTRGFCQRVPDVSCVGDATHIGSYGGANAFTASRGAWDPDHADQPQEIPVVGAIITGTVGHHATVYVRPTTLLAIVAPASEEHVVIGDALLEGRADAAQTIARDSLLAAKGDASISEGERHTLWAFKGLKSGEPRREYLARLAKVTGGAFGTTACVDSLVARGYLKRASNGATQITTAGRNADPVENRRAWW